MLHHRARAPRPVACRRVWVLYRKRLSFFHYFVRLSTAYFNQFSVFEYWFSHTNRCLKPHLTPDVFLGNTPRGRTNRKARRRRGDTRGKGPGAMVLATDEKTPLRVAEEGDRRRDDAASSGADRHHAHRVSHRNADARRFDPTRSPRWTTRTPSTGARFAGWCARWVRRRRWPRPRPRSWSWCGRSARTPAGLVAPGPRTGPPAAFAADEGVAGTSAGGAFAGALAAVRGASGGAGLADAEASLGAGQRDAESSKAPFYMDDDAYRPYAASARVRRRSRRRTRRWASTSRSSSPWRRTRGASSSRATPRSSSCPRCPRPSPRPPGRSARGRASTRRRSARRRSRRRGGRSARRAGRGPRGVQIGERRRVLRVRVRGERRGARDLELSQRKKAKNAAAGRCWPTPGTRCSPGGQAAVLQDGRGPERPHARRAVVEAASTPAVSAADARDDGRRRGDERRRRARRPWSRRGPHRRARGDGSTAGRRPQGGARRFVAPRSGHGAAALPSGAYTRREHA